MRVQGSVEIDRPLQEVFNYVSDVDNYPKWMAHVLGVRKEAPGPPWESDRFVVAIKSVGRSFETPYERTSYEADRYTRTVDVESSGLLRLLEPLQKRAADRQLRKDLQTLKGVVEAR